METDWAENRAKLPQDIIRSTIGKVFDSLTRPASSTSSAPASSAPPTGSEIYITHRGMDEVYIGERKDATVWQPRPADPQLEAEFLARLMVKLGAKDEEAKAPVAARRRGGRAAGRAGARPHRRRPAGADAAGRRRLRPRLAPRRPGARPQRLHGRRPRPRARACTSCATSTRRSPAARSRTSSPSCSASARRTTAPALAKYRVKVKAEGNDAARVAVLDSQGTPETRRSRQAHRQPAARRPEVSRRRRAGDGGRDPLLQPGQRQHRQRHRGRGDERHHDDAAAGRLRLLAARARRCGWRAPGSRAARSRRGLRHPRARRSHRLRAGARRAPRSCRCG